MLLVNIITNFQNLNHTLAGFPAGTVSGAPKIRAMEIIDELETTKEKFMLVGLDIFQLTENLILV